MAHAYNGRTATDKITGFTGVITGFVEYLTGCNQALLVPKSENGNKLVESQWFDVQRLEFADNAQIVLDNTPTPGCDRAAPKR